MTGVAVGVVADDEPRRLQRGGELGPDTVGDTHALEVKSGDRRVKPRVRSQ
jgi:hypothetical protein